MARPGIVARHRAAGERAGARAGTRSSASRGWRNWSAAGCPDRAKRILRAARKWQRERSEELRCRWRRSLQLRVVTTTLALSALVIAVLGFFLTQQIADGLLLNKERSATAQVSQGLTVAESSPLLNRAPSSAAAADTFLYPTAQELQNASGNDGSYDVVIEVSQDRVASPVYTRGVAGGADPLVSIPAALAASVQAEQDHGGASKMYYAPTMIVSMLDRASQPGPRDRHAAGQLLPALLPVPHAAGAADPPVGAAHADRGRAGADRPARPDRFAGDAVGGHPGPARGAGGAAADRGPPRGADAGPRRRRPRRARDVVQRHGGEPAG